MKWVAKRKGGSKCFSKPYFRGLGLLNEKKRKIGSYFWRGDIKTCWGRGNCVSRQKCPLGNWKYEVSIQKIVLG